MSAKRDEYVKKLQAKLDEWNRDIDSLEKKAGRVAADARTQYDRQIFETKLKKNELEQKLDEVRSAGAEAWEDLKSGLDLAWDALGDAIRSAKSKFE